MFLILIRHSLPEINPAIPARAWGLSQEGRRRCLGLVEALRPYQPECLYASQEPKAQETARLVAEYLQIPWESRPNLHEHERSGVPYTDHRTFEQQIAEFFRHPGKVVFGQESANQARKRFQAAMNQLPLDSAQNRFVVAHGTVISLYVSQLCNINAFSFWQKLSLPACVVLDPQNARLVNLINDIGSRV